MSTAGKEKGRLLVASMLLVCAPVFGEMLSSSSPPREFFQPLNLVILVGLYGSGALLVQESARRWKKG